MSENRAPSTSKSQSQHLQGSFIFGDQQDRIWVIYAIIIGEGQLKHIKLGQTSWIEESVPTKMPPSPMIIYHRELPRTPSRQPIRLVHRYGMYQFLVPLPLLARLRKATICERSEQIYLNARDWLGAQTGKGNCVSKKGIRWYHVTVMTQRYRKCPWLAKFCLAARAHPRPQRIHISDSFFARVEFQPNEKFKHSWCPYRCWRDFEKPLLVIRSSQELNFNPMKNSNSKKFHGGSQSASSNPATIMVNLPNITTLLAAAGGIIIVDYQNRAVENSFGLGFIANPVIGDVRGATSFQEWTFVTTPTVGAFNLQNTNTASGSPLFLSYPAAPNAPLRFGQAVLMESPLLIEVATINPVTNAVMLIEQTSGASQALTSWDVEGGSNLSPLTWEDNTGRVQQDLECSANVLPRGRDIRHGPQIHGPTKNGPKLEPWITNQCSRHGYSTVLTHLVSFDLVPYQAERWTTATQQFRDPQIKQCQYTRTHSMEHLLCFTKRSFKESDGVILLVRAMQRIAMLHAIAGSLTTKLEEIQAEVLTLFVLPFILRLIKTPGASEKNSTLGLVVEPTLGILCFLTGVRSSRKDKYKWVQIQSCEIPREGHRRLRGKQFKCLDK
ncbi:hypothetical protein C8R44DRAFT_734203 [Mycena epipterygia]|nr:hypothetical protein C8R44DRAFT_734203 [Mycena epipterygia]